MITDVNRSDGITINIPQVGKKAYVTIFFRLNQSNRQDYERKKTEGEQEHILAPTIEIPN